MLSDSLSITDSQAFVCSGCSDGKMKMYRPRESLIVSAIQLLFFITTLALFIFSSYTSCDEQLDLVRVETSLGEIVGQQTGNEFGVLVNRFLGIPYAKPPVGELRFAAPQTPEPFDKPYHAVEWPSQCIQNRSSFINLRWNQFNTNNNYSEDCLYLNVWTPTVDKNASLPVLVWIHGGGMFSGTSSFDVYESTWLAGSLNAVVVTLNYRVGLLGYMYSENNPDTPGNQGLRDQIEALEWIKRNIHNFGGNSNQVTIWGQSAGAWSVSAHILMARSRELFQNAIMMSGAAITLNAISPPQFYWNELAPGILEVNCTLGQHNAVTKQTVECLRKLDANTIDEILYRLPITAYSKMPLFVIDGDIFEKNPKELFKTGNFKKDVNLLISTVEDEGSFILNSIGGKFAVDNPLPITFQEGRQFLELYSANVYPPTQYPSKLIDYYYYSGMAEPNNSMSNESYEQEFVNHIRQQTALAAGDGQLACPTIEFGKRVTRHGTGNTAAGGRVYSMRYRAKIGIKMLCSEWAAGACHCDDLYPAFGMPFRYRSQYNDREREISHEYSRILANFIRTGKPRSDKEWPPSMMVDDEHIVSPVYEIHADYSHRPENYVINAEHEKCSLIWNQFLSD